MAGFMAGLDSEPYDRAYSDADLYRRILRRFEPQTRRLSRLTALVFLQGLVGTGVPITVAAALDLIREDTSWGAIAAVVGLAVVLGTAGWGLNYLSQASAARAVGEMVLRLRDDAIATTLRRDMRFFDTHLPGRIISRITSDTQEMGALVTLFSDILASGLMVVLVVGVMVFKNVELALWTLATAPLIWLATLVFRRQARVRSTGSRRILSVLNGQIQESISGISVAKGFRQEQAIYDAFVANNQRSYEINLSLGRVFNTIFPVLNILMGVGTALLVYFGGLSVMGGDLDAVSTGDWYFFVQGIGLVFFPLTSLASFSSQLQNGLAASERVFALLDHQSLMVQDDPGQTPAVIRGEIRFEGIDFHYIEGEPVFVGFNLTIPVGQSIALVGHTGAGKSSIVNLLSRFHEYQAGTIRIDGQDIRTLDLKAYRRQLGVILQEQLLFDASVADNIRYGRPEASIEEVRGALARIGAEKLISELPYGLDTVVGERGARLSLGQRQLVSLARTILQDPAILVLDEATASVDPITEVRLQRALERVMAQRTTLIVAHRLTTIRRVDRIIVLDHGRIVEEGNHEELMARGGYYLTLYDTYYRHQSLEYIEESGAMHGGAEPLPGIPLEIVPPRTLS